MSAKYYYAVSDKWIGPVTLDDLKLLAAREELKRSDQIWTKGMVAWQAAGLTPAIFEGLPPDLDPQMETIEPPPLPIEDPSTIQVLGNDQAKQGISQRSENDETTEAQARQNALKTLMEETIPKLIRMPGQLSVV